VKGLNDHHESLLLSTVCSTEWNYQIHHVCVSVLFGDTTCHLAFMLSASKPHQFGIYTP